MASAPQVRIHRSITKALRLFDADRFRWLDEAAALGPVAGLRMGPVTTWIVTDAEAARTVLMTESAAWTRPPATVVPIRVGVGENLFTQSDMNWSQLQSFVAPAFRKRALEPRLAEMQALIDEEVGAIPYDEDVDLELAMGRIALVLAAFMLLGERLDPARAEEIASHQREVVSWVGKQLGRLTGILPIATGDRGREMKRHRKVLNAYADEVIARAQAAPHDSDTVLAALLRARPAGKPLTWNELRGHVLGLFLAGNETTAAALSWAVVHGAQQPDEWAKLRTDPTQYTSAFLSESLRLTPAVWGIPRTPRRAGVTVVADGMTTRVRRSQLATLYLRGINRDPKVWPDPLHFDPARHFADTAREHRALLPFGLGPRGCIGQHLAMAEMLAVLPALARHGNVVIDTPAREDPSFALRVDGGLKGHFAVAP